MRNAIIIMLACAGLAALAAEPEWIPRDGDRVTGMCTDWIDLGADVVDLTGREAVDEAMAEWVWRSDSTFSEVRRDLRRDFLVRGDSVLLLKVEGNGRKIEYDSAMMWMHFPSVGAVASDVRLRARRHQREHFSGVASCCEQWNGLADVIIAPADTLKGARRHTVTTRMACTASSLEGYPGADVPVDSSMVFVEEVTGLYVRQARYPIVQSWLSERYRGDSLTYSMRHTVICGLDSQPYEPERLRAQADADPDAADRGYDPSRLSVDRSGGTLTVSYTSATDAEIEMILADIQGHVYGAMSRRSAAADETVTLHIDLTRLPRGEYILYLKINGITTTAKIPVP